MDKQQQNGTYTIDDSCVGHRCDAKIFRTISHSPTRRLLMCSAGEMFLCGFGRQSKGGNSFSRKRRTSARCVLKLCCNFRAQQQKHPCQRKTPVTVGNGGLILTAVQLLLLSILLLCSRFTISPSCTLTVDVKNSPEIHVMMCETSPVHWVYMRP